MSQKLGMRWGVIAAWMLLFTPFASALSAADDSTLLTTDNSNDLYLRKVKPLLKARCYACHGALKQEGGLRLDTAEFARQGGDSGEIIDVDFPDESPLIQRVSTADVTERMPPEFEGELLDPDQIAVLIEWIKSGASGPDGEVAEQSPEEHWAFQPIVRPQVPEDSLGWGRNPIDAFVLEKLQSAGVSPQPLADPLVLARRLKSDLLGLPLTPDEAMACGNTLSAEQLSSLVDRYLDDPRAGERWARHWMDIWRYSDWWGLGDQLRNSQKHLWHWRDWIVESLNDDLPYDEMIRQMLAADELYPNDRSKLRATGYLARNFFLFNRAQWMEETVEHVSKGFLGLTTNCAKCHDHKYDPISQTDFYRLRAFFEPYHVRMDIVPGETDIDRDGIPRVYDGVLDAKTYRYIRGDERNPDTSEEIAPGVFSFLQDQPVEIRPVSLPPEAWQPDRRPWIAEANIAAAERRVASALKSMKTAEGDLSKARTTEAEMRKQAEAVANQNADENSKELKSVLATNFIDKENANWKLLDGQWEEVATGLKQSATGPNRAAIRLLTPVPQDFDVTFEFTILDGQMWKSVGISFDAPLDANSSTPSSEDTEQHVYVSAYAGGSKVHASYFSNGQWVYPGGDPLRTMPIETNHRYKFRLQVRDSLINATLDDQLVIACELPLQRRPGAMQFTAFDAVAVFHSVDLRPLDPKTELAIPKSGPPPGTQPKTLTSAIAAAAGAQRAVELAEVEYRIATAELDSFVQRAEALQQIWACETTARDDAGPSQAPLNQEAITAKSAALMSLRQLERLRAEKRLIQARHKQETEQGDRIAIEKEVTEAQSALEKILANLDAPLDLDAALPRFVGAKWTPTRFLSSGNDDPEVSFPAVSTGRRSALANWIASSENPLTARVAVNHIWTRLMGQPLVPTVFDFGRKGLPPTHPELLDWLASELIENGWSIKHIQRLILNSSTYALSSSAEGNSAGMQNDPDNQLLWHRRPVRIESQIIRDSLLALSNQLDTTLGGPSVPADKQAESRRRSLYFFHSNNHRDLFLSTFDEALVTSCYRREESIVPQQALAMANSKLTLEVSRQVGKQLISRHQDPRERIRLGFHWILGNVPSEDEIAQCLTALQQWESLGDHSEEEIWSQMAWVFLNHNDFVTLR